MAVTKKRMPMLDQRCRGLRVGIAGSSEAGRDASTGIGLVRVNIVRRLRLRWMRS